jgi:glycerol-3-phosphate dehydrogenase
LNFSSRHRATLLSSIQTDAFDLIVIGGGITGAGIALDAASRGLKVCLLEKMDFAYGTSSRSTKLIHGGLRYLKQLEFGLVKEVGSERAIVHTLAPHLVVPEKMLLPLHEKRGLGYWLTSIGLMIYDFLAGVKREDQRRMLTRKQTLRTEPLLRQDEIKGGALYAEYRTDDSRLTIEILKTAARYGATLINYCQVENFLYHDHRIVGLQARDVADEKVMTVHAKVVVNAAGPWVDDLRILDKSRVGKRLHLTKGVHIVVDRKKLPVSQAIYFDVDDGRMIFAIPRGRTTYIGTTDTDYTGDKNHVVTSPDDARYLLNAVNKMFPSVNLGFNDIESSWAGLRPLIYEEGKSASELSRKDEIFESPSGLISIAGGKLTGYRKMAERVVNLVARKYYEDRGLRKCYTENISLTVNAMRTRSEVKNYLGKVNRRLTDLGVPAGEGSPLVELFGSQVDEILILLEQELKRRDWEAALVIVQLDYCINMEMVCSLADFFVRRTGMIYFFIDRVHRYRDIVAERMALEFSWPATRLKQEHDALDQLLRDAALQN